MKMDQIKFSTEEIPDQRTDPFPWIRFEIGFYCEDLAKDRGPGNFLWEMPFALPELRWFWHYGDFVKLNLSGRQFIVYVTDCSTGGNQAGISASRMLKALHTRNAVEVPNVMEQ